MKNRLLRALADMENLRKRTEREVADARQYGIASFARDILGVADNFRRALESVGPELRNSEEPAVTSLIEGVELTERDLQKALEKNGIRKIEPMGEKFDPNLHQAMYEVPDAVGAVGHRRAGDPAGLCDRRAHPAAGDGRDRQGRPEGRRRGACRQRQFGRLELCR